MPDVASRRPASLPRSGGATGGASIRVCIVLKLQRKKTTLRELQRHQSSRVVRDDHAQVQSTVIVTAHARVLWLSPKRSGVQ